MCTALDHAAMVALYLFIFLMVYGFVAAWLIGLEMMKQGKRKPKLVKSYDEWGI